MALEVTGQQVSSHHAHQSLQVPTGGKAVTTLDFHAAVRQRTGLFVCSVAMTVECTTCPCSSSPSLSSPSCSVTQHAMHAVEIAREMDVSRFDGVVCVGGDGMLSEVR